MESVHFTDYFVITICEGQRMLHFCDTLDEVCYCAAQYYCFSDCSDERVIAVMANGEMLHYVGWLPDMEYRFVNDAGVIVYDEWFPNWEH